MKRKTRKYEPGDMQAHQIKVLLLKFDETQVGIAKSLKVSPTHVHNVIHNKVTSNRVRLAICAAIRKHPAEVWPSAYLKRREPPKPGRPKSPRSERISELGL